MPADDQPCLFPPQTHVVSNNTRSWKKSNVGRMIKWPQFLIVLKEKSCSFLAFSCPGDISRRREWCGDCPRAGS